MQNENHKPTYEELIAENKQLKHELETISSRLESSLSVGNLAWWDWDVQNNRVTFNELKVTMLGYSREDFENVGYEAFVNLLHPDDYENVMQAMRDHLSGKALLYEVEYRIKAKSGQYTWYYDRGSITERDASGKPVRLKGVVFDITERKRIEAEKQAYYEKMIASIDEIKVLRGILPICASCKKIRDDNGYWRQVEEYITANTEAVFSHGLCPSCVKKLYPEYNTGSK